MKFICLICAETVMEQMPAADAEKHYQEYAEFTTDIKRKGQFISANRLTPADTAITVRVRSWITTDGPTRSTARTVAVRRRNGSSAPAGAASDATSATDAASHSAGPAAGRDAGGCMARGT